MESILAVKDKSDRQLLINTFDTFWKLKNGSFLIFQNPHYNSPNYRTIRLENKYIRITIDYHVSGLWPLSSLRRGPSFLELGGIPIDSTQIFTTLDSALANKYHLLEYGAISKINWIKMVFL
jgi:hypothetical protein